MNQKTLKREISCRGIGLHSGAAVRMTIGPAKAGEGIVFLRTDLPKGESLILARYDNVTDTKLCTTIENEFGARVSTIEHLMAALRGCDIDNALITIDGPEVPAMDGSALPFVELIEKAGIAVQSAPRLALKIKKSLSFDRDGKWVRFSPSDYSVFAGEIDFDHQAIKKQSFEVYLLNGNFKHDIAPCRTFGFAHEVAYLKTIGKAKGADLSNAIGIDESGIMNPEDMHHEDDFIRHKLLDAMGDLYLAGMPVIGRYDSYKGGHELNNGLLHALFESPDSYAVIDLSSGLALSPCKAPSSRMIPSSRPETIAA